jgi:hypothetical protein
MRAFAAGLAITDGFAFGATLGLTEMNARTQALVDAQARIDTTGGIALDARDDTRGIGLGIAAGASTGGTSISAANGVVISRSAVDAQVMQGANLTSSGDISVSAKRSQELAGLAYHIAAGNSVGVGGGLGLGTDKGVTTAQIDSSSLTAGGDAAVRAGNNTKVVTSAVGAAVGGSVGVTGSVAMTFKSDTVLAEINDSNVLANDAVLVEALNGGRLDGVGGAEESFFGQLIRSPAASPTAAQRASASPSASSKAPRRSMRSFAAIAPSPPMGRAMASAPPPAARPAQPSLTAKPWRAAASASSPTTPPK